jgi:hypothetical protein
VLQARGSVDQVVSFGDDLSWGPIGDERLDARSAYLAKENPFPDDYWGGLRETHDDFFREVSQPAEQRIIWLGFHCPAEIAAYLAYLDKFSHLPAEVIRPDEYLPEHPRYGQVGAIGVLNADQVADALDHAPRQPVSNDSHLFGRWAELVAENAMLRIVRDGSLISAAIEAHDHFIIGAARTDWMRHVRVIGHALGATFDAGVWVNTEFLFSRLFHLVDAGVLEADGDVRAWTDEPRRSDAKVRLAQR